MLGFKTLMASSIIIPLFILVVPIFDTMCAIIRRKLKGQAIDHADKEEIASFVELVKREGGIAHAEQVMYEYRNRALQLLPASADEALRFSLTAYIDYVIERKK